MATSVPLIVTVSGGERDVTIQKYEAKGYKLIHEERLPNGMIRLTFQK